jgi:hypothetical protein
VARALKFAAASVTAALAAAVMPSRKEIDESVTEA